MAFSASARQLFSVNVANIIMFAAVRSISRDLAARLVMPPPPIISCTTTIFFD
jgi:hypothetical protein